MSGETPVTPERPEPDPSSEGTEAQAGLDQPGDTEALGISRPEGTEQAAPAEVAALEGTHCPESEQSTAADTPLHGSDRDAMERIRDLKVQLEALRREHEALNSQYMRIAADFDNFRKRQHRDQEDQRLQLTCTTLAEILPVVDNFERARQQLNPQNEEAQGLHRSYQGLYKQLVDVLRKFGVSAMRVEGEPFDPNLHEAVMRELSDHHAEDVVIAELQRGYQLNERVLRHALVKVSMGPGQAVGHGEEAGETASEQLEG